MIFDGTTIAQLDSIKIGQTTPYSKLIEEIVRIDPPTDTRPFWRFELKDGRKLITTEQVTISYRITI